MDVGDEDKPVQRGVIKPVPAVGSKTVSLAALRTDCVHWLPSPAAQRPLGGCLFLQTPRSAPGRMGACVPLPVTPGMEQRSAREERRVDAVSVPKAGAVRLLCSHLVAVATAGVERWVKRVQGGTRGSRQHHTEPFKALNNSIKARLKPFQKVFSR